MSAGTPAGAGLGVTPGRVFAQAEGASASGGHGASSRAHDALLSNDVTVFRARRILTTDPGRPVAEAVAVLDGRILSVGTLEQMQPWLSRFDVTIDDSLADKVLLPRFIEAHSHFWMSAGLMALDDIGPLPWPSLNGGMNPPHPTFDDVIAYLGELDRGKDDQDQPIIAWGFDPANQGGSLDRDTLDAISSTRPIFVIGFAPHFAFLNSPAIERAGVDESVTSTHVERYPDGRLSGVFTEAEGVGIGLQVIAPVVASLGGAAGLKSMAGVARRVGITTVAELIFGVVDYDSELNDHIEATRDPDLPIRFRLSHQAPTFNATHGDDALALIAGDVQHENDKLFFRGVEFLSDGSFPLMGSLVNFPGYLDGGNGLPGDASYEGMLPYWKAGMQIHCHANGDRAVDITLDLPARLQAEHPRFDHRFTIEHYSMSDPMQARRLKALGGLASVNNYFSRFRSLLHSENASGPDRAQAEARLGSLEREGVIFALHSDYPQVVVPMDPLTAVFAAVNRIAEDDETVVAEGERIGVDRALRAVTIDAAYVLGMEDEIGSIEPGKFADFAVLEDDPTEVAPEAIPEAIKDIAVWGTVLGGRVFS